MKQNFFIFFFGGTFFATDYPYNKCVRLRKALTLRTLKKNKFKKVCKVLDNLTRIKYYNIVRKVKGDENGKNDKA